MRLFYFLLLLAIAQPLPAQRTTLLDKDGERMRGVPLALGRNGALGETRAAVRNPDWWAGLDSLEINTVRLCWVGPWYDRHDFGPTWTVEEVLPWIDDAVANAAANDLNLIINYHNVNEYGETGGFGRMAEFWEQVAPRYADNDRVYYELNNEQSFDGNDYLRPAFRDTMQRMYERVHELAPERHLIMLSMNSLNLPLKRIVDAYDWLDYDYTTVSFHWYGWFQTNTSVGERNLEELISADYPLICTEWDVRQELNYVVRFYDQDVAAQKLEELGISWVDWRDWGDATNDQFTDVLIPDARANGYWWGTPVSVRDARPSLALGVFPNPVGRVLHLQIPEEVVGPVTVRIVDALGRRVLTRRVLAGTGPLPLSVGDLPAGSYTARVDWGGEFGVVRFLRGE